MNDPVKSDPRIVATKPTNKAGRPGAELVEPRLGTKGNAGRQSTHRSQSRVRVTQALDRVRNAARQRKKEQFTALLHHVNVDALRTAFYALKRKAAAGVDGVTWQDYEADLELRAVSDRRESALGDLDSQDVSNGRVSLMHRFAGTACLALILLIYESV